MKIDDYAKDGGEEFLPRCIAFYNRIPIDSLTILLQTQLILVTRCLPPSLVQSSIALEPDSD